MESTVTTSNKIEIIQNAIQQLIQSKQAETPFLDDEDDNNLLAKLLSQLESLKGDGVSKPCEPSNEVPSCNVSELETESKDETEASPSDTGEDVVVKELKKLERQNRITHWLLSALIVITVAWQLSEVSLLLKLKHGLTHPFKSVGSILSGMLKRPVNGLVEADKHSSTKDNETDNPLKLPKMDLSSLMMNDDED